MCSVSKRDCIYRQPPGLSQKDLAQALHVQQSSVAKLERRTDRYLSSLRNHIEAMGGQLDLIARFPDGSVKISNFSNLDVITDFAEVEQAYDQDRRIFLE